MNFLLSEHKSGQMQQAPLQPTVFLWSLYPLGIWHLLTGWHSVGQSGQECCSKSVASKKRTQVQKPQGANCRWFFSLPSPLAPLPHRFLLRPRISFRAVVSLTLQSTKGKTPKKKCQLRTQAMFVGNYFNPILRHPLLPPPCSYTPVGHHCFTSWNWQAIRGYTPKITYF